MKEVVKILTEKGKTISTMESCTGGEIADSITSNRGSSNVFSFGAVTYSNEFKIKMGVNAETIEKYTVYSTETAMEMSKAIAKYAGTDYGVGITGKIDSRNPNENKKIYVSIYDNNANRHYNMVLRPNEEVNRAENKKIIMKSLKEKLPISSTK